MILKSRPEIIKDWVDWLMNYCIELKLSNLLVEMNIPWFSFNDDEYLLIFCIVDWWSKWLFSWSFRGDIDNSVWLIVDDNEFGDPIPDEDDGENNLGDIDR